MYNNLKELIFFLLSQLCAHNESSHRVIKLAREIYFVMMMRHRRARAEGLDFTRSDGGLEAFFYFPSPPPYVSTPRIEQKNMNIHIHNTHEICTRNVCGGSTEKITKSAARRSRISQPPETIESQMLEASTRNQRKNHHDTQPKFKTGSTQYFIAVTKHTKPLALETNLFLTLNKYNMNCMTRQILWSLIQFFKCF